MNKINWINIKEIKPYDEMAILVQTKTGWIGLSTVDESGFFNDDTITVYNNDGDHFKIKPEDVCYWIPLSNMPENHIHEFRCITCHLEQGKDPVYFGEKVTNE